MSEELKSALAMPAGAAPVLGIIEYKGMMFIAAANGVYQLCNDRKTLVRIEFDPLLAGTARGKRNER